MPELPEVEVTRRRIERWLVGRTVARVITTAPSYFFVTPPARLRQKLAGRRVKALERRGKYLVARLDDGSRLLLHLGMTGQLLISGARSARLSSGGQAFRPDRHTHLRLVFDDGGPEVLLRDVRKFGKCAHIAPGKTHDRLDKLGQDALSVDAAALYAAARKRTIPVKTLLLDQAVLAGVGNIYADEALHAARIRPTRRADRVSRSECDALIGALRRVLLRSIAAGGTSISDYLQPDGSEGDYRRVHRVYGRSRKPCRRCGAAIRRVVLGQRSTHYCPTCQR
jgi:formamidopyrimidine-DNA glycosylase